MNLLQLKDEECAVIKSIPDGEAGERLEALGLRVGKRIQKVSGMPFRGPITLLLDGRHFAVAHAISGKIEIDGVDCPVRPALEKSRLWPKFI
ncbi:MAG: ferrous iron transport protein A [Synergistaceae bacterium]|nr:ferrous iron transport protein A [Synergistaceae bacterium]